MLANITLANMFALIGVIFFVATLLMQTMRALRVANMIGCTFFVDKTFLLYLLLRPVDGL